jgi:two-component system, OmpR family, sensor kinase
MRVPLRMRLTLAFAVAMAVVLTALGIFLYVRLGAELLRSIDMGLSPRAEVITAGLGENGGGFTDPANDLIDPDEAFAQVLDPASPGAIVDSSPGVSGSPLVPVTELRTIDEPTFLSRREPGLDDAARLLVVPVEGSFVVVGAILSDRQEALDRLLVLFAIGGPIALILTAAAGWMLAGAALRPVERMRREAAAISVSGLDRRLPVPDTADELARLATTLNEMLERLKESLGRERRFVDDAAHELRSPLGILKGELDLSLSRARSPQEMHATIRAASEETNRLARLAQDLLVLTRARGGQIPLHREEVDLREVITEACRDHSERARSVGVELMVRAPDGLVRVDRARLRQAIENLVDNSLRHVPRGGRIEISADVDGTRVSVSVRDSGPGFPPAFLARAFEPFARGEGDAIDPNGAGLGLAIVRAVAEAHGGSAVAENPAEGGAVVTLQLER